MAAASGVPADHASGGVAGVILAQHPALTSPRAASKGLDPPTGMPADLALDLGRSLARQQPGVDESVVRIPEDGHDSMPVRRIQRATECPV